MSNRNQTIFHLDLSSLGHNYDFFSKKLKPGVDIMAVIKAAAYGHEAVAFAKYLAKKEVAYFAVATVPEGVELRTQGIVTPILVFSPQPEDLELCVTHQLEPALYNFRVLHALISVLEERKIHLFPVHLNFNTGMNRLGFEEKDLAKLTALLKANTSIIICGVFSHLSSSDDCEEQSFTKHQIRTFDSISEKIQQSFPYKILRHLANSSAVLHYPESHYDMVRIGIGLYGCANDEKYLKHLKSVGVLCTKILQIRSIKKGESVSYNRSLIASKDMRIATLSIGYADGILRSWSKGKGFVRVHGEKAYIVGNVTMDMCMVDVTDIACDEGDEVTIMSSTEDIYELSQRTQTISYELMTNISKRVPRLITDGKKC